MAKNRDIRWSFVLLIALLLSIIAASAIWGPIAIQQHVTAAKAAEAERPTLQTFVEGGGFSYLDGKAKNVLPLLPYDSISLHRTGCFGDCPAYLVTFFKDGHATLVTDDWSDKARKRYTGKIWIGDYVRLTQMVELAKNAVHQSNYSGQWTDDYTATVRASSNDQTWVVSDYGQVAPVEVWALEALLHNFREHDEWAPTAGP